MIIDDIKDRSLEAINAIKGRIEESSLYIQLKERYDALNPTVQRLILTATGLILAYVIVQIPMSYHTAGSENLALFEENRDLILDLHRVKRRTALSPTAPPSMSLSEIENRSRAVLAAARVPADQIKTVATYDNSGHQPSAFIPKSIEQKGVEIQLANLNLTQIIDIGHSLLRISDSIRMVGLEIKPGAQAGSYFDTTYKIVSFASAGKNK